MRFVIMNQNRQSFHGVLFFRIPDLSEGAYKVIAHFSIREGDFCVHCQCVCLGKFAQLKPCQPPVNRASFDSNFSVFLKYKGQRYQFRVADSLIEGSFEFFVVNVFFYRIVNPDFASGGNAVLTFPKFDQPAFPAIRKCDRLAVHDHVKKRGTLIISLTIPHLSLPAVHQGVKVIPLHIIGKPGFL